MLTRVELKVAGDTILARAFETTALEAEDMTVPLDRFADHLLRQIGEQFTTEGVAGGTPWQKLSLAYERWKEEHYPGRPILVRTGAMRARALDKRESVRVTPLTMVYEIGGEEGDRAYWHQTGAGHLPARPIVALGLDARRQVDRIFAGWLNDLRHANFGTAA